ncbi:sigma-54 interaction domain-containing protein [Risungbinella massiliensis]|uniref:sigma-54 interaction domain-containing protein n=1 Tax=Risungbinella massiliensis TaxID=1329796 RepID=UPI0005CC6675|nr:sigma-54-dependent Fis family transcriptional regulator [Risungbinella massiliensis]
MTTFSKDFIQEILELVEDAIHIVDHNGKTVWYNRRAAYLDELTPSEVMGSHVLELFPSLSEKSSTLLQVIQTKKAIPRNKQTYQNRHGKKITTFNQTVPLYLDGIFWGAMEVAQDVTSVQELSERVIDLEQRVNRGSHSSTKKTERAYQFSDFLTQDRDLQQSIQQSMVISTTDLPVWIVGETGTGKEILIQSIHGASKRKNKPFIVQNCASIPGALLESLLFGTAKGAFTGAEERKGLFEIADGGTLFLDEIQMLPPDLQAKLLRVIEDGKVRRVGDWKERRVDVRILVATNEDPQQNMTTGKLRSDLYYRLNGFQITLSPLRERRGDIPLLIEHFLHDASPTYYLSEQVRKCLLLYHWPGNVRELKHVIASITTMTSEKGEIGMEHLPAQIVSAKEKQEPSILSGGLVEELAMVEKKLITRALEKSNGNVSIAADLLQIPRQTLQYRIKKWFSS